MSTAYLALGANLGDRLGTLQAAVVRINALPQTRVTLVSDVFETEPVGGPQQGPYLNAVLAADTTLLPTELLAACHRIETELGRVREQRWAARTLDIDVLSYDEKEMSGDVELPHPRAHQRGFVMVPWEQVAPDLWIPGHGRVADVAATVVRTGVTPFVSSAQLGAGLAL